eukprot:8986823-Pyramimonas_sp.AAC.1
MQRRRSYAICAVACKNLYVTRCPAKSARYILHSRWASETPGVEGREESAMQEAEETPHHGIRN